MVGILKRIIVVDLQENNIQKPMILINPEITWRSSELQVFNEASICFPGIAADISRSKVIKVSFVNYKGKIQELCINYRKLFIGLVHYDRLIRQIKLAFPALICMLKSLEGEITEYLFIDATPMAVCHNF